MHKVDHIIYFDELKSTYLQSIGFVKAQIVQKMYQTSFQIRACAALSMKIQTVQKVFRSFTPIYVHYKL